MAFLGKISAVVTANTTDFTKKIEETSKQVLSLKKKLDGYQLNLNTKSLDGTLTQLQKFNRTLQEAAKLSASVRLANGFPDLGRLAAQFKAFEDVGKPLTKVKNEIESLANSVQARLYPELEKVQKGFQDLYRELGDGRVTEAGKVITTTFEQAASRVEGLTNRLSTLRRVAASSADIGRLVAQLETANTGASFVQPRTQEALQRSLSLRGQAEKLPARVRGSEFEKLALDAERNAQRIEEQAARVQAANLEILNYGRTPRRLDALSREQNSLNRLTADQEVINNQFGREIRASQIRQIVSPEAAPQADALIDRLKSISSQLRAINGQQFEGLIRSAAGVVSQFNAGTASARQAKQAVDALAASLNSVNTGRGLADQTRSLLFSGSELRRQGIQSDFDREMAAGGGRAAVVRRDVNLSREALNSEIIPRDLELQSRAAASGEEELQKKADRLISLSKQASNELEKATKLANNKNFDESARRLERYNALLEEQRKIREDIAERLGTLDEAKIQQDLFLQAAGRSGPRLSQGAMSAASDLSLAAQFRGQISDGKARIEIELEIQRITARVLELQKALASVAASDLGADEKLAELARLDKELANTTADLPRFIAERSGGTRSADDIAAAFDAARNQPGNVSARRSAVAQLAFQQALFAVDDLVSSTGGLEYKLRAVGNNITQLGLLLGQSGIIKGLTATTGLFAGLAVVLGGQAVSAILRWVTGAQSADDQTKSLNDTLSRQKSIVEELRQAFESLGRSISRGAFSQAGQAAQGFRDELDRVQKKQKELREGRVASLDSEVQRERGEQTRLERELQGESSPGRRVALVSQIEESRRRERERVERLSAAPPPSRESLLRTVVRTIRPSEFLDGGRFNYAESADLARRREASARAGFFFANSPLDQAALIRQRISERREAAARPLSFLSPTQTTETLRAREDVANLQTALNALELPLQKALDELTNQIVDSSRGAASSIESAQQDVAEAIRRGVVGAAEFQSALDNSARLLDAAYKQLEAAQKIEDPVERERQIRLAQTTVRDAENRRDAVNERAREIRLGRTFGGERTTAALSSLQGNERFANEFAGLRARLAAAVDAEIAARSAYDQSLKSGTQAEQEAARATLDAAQRASELAAAAGEAAVALEEFLSRTRKIADQAISASEGLADDAQRRFTEKPTSQNRQERDDAERQLIRDREQVARAQNAISRRRSEASSDPRVAALNAEIEGIVQERKRLEEEAKLNNTSVDPAEAERLANREAELVAQREQVLFDLTEAERAAADAIAYEIDARRRLAEQILKEAQFDEDVRRRQNPAGDANRGLDLLDSPAQRAGREVAQGLADIDEAVDERIRGIIDRSNGRPGQLDIEEARRVAAQGQEAASRFVNEQMRAGAPAIFSMADAVQNAILQGPSRAALQATDVTSVEGQRELNRLLRGDDGARDQNIVELEKQSQILEGIKTAAERTAQQMGIVLDIK